MMMMMMITYMRLVLSRILKILKIGMMMTITRTKMNMMYYQIWKVSIHVSQRITAVMAVCLA